MKIGIITLSSSNNCGSLLQCYALKKLLESYGNVDVINFSSDRSHSMYDLFPKDKPLKVKLKRVLDPCFINLLSEKLQYNKFRRKIIGISGKELFSKDLYSIADKYDVVVTGSDQVWNVVMSDFDESFFLNWTNKTKIAYAPSLGGHRIQESRYCDKYVSLLKEFSMISVRENPGLDCLKELGFNNVEKVLDPTLTVDLKEFERLIGKPMVKGKYYFFYSWAYNQKTILDSVSKEGKLNGVPVYVIDARKWINKNPKCWDFKLSKQGPLAFLNLMYYADRCFVESFHGLIFAYLFKKDFYLLDWQTEYEFLDARLKDLVELLNVKERVIMSNDTNRLHQNEIRSYTKDDRVRLMKNNSLEFIKRALQ